MNNTIIKLLTLLFFATNLLFADDNKLLEDLGIIDNKIKKSNNKNYIIKDLLENMSNIVTLVIDPGHGGHDSGAVGSKGTKEKDINLKIAKKLKNILNKNLPNIKVILTRNSDVYVSLNKRAKIAENADLFISIHANASKNKKARGVETYYLNVGHNRYNKRLALSENIIGYSPKKEVDFILADIDTKVDLKDSIFLSNLIQKNIINNLRKKWSNIKDLGVKPALFHVLINSKTPAVLVESSFLSNKIEEKRLRSNSYQNIIAKSIFSAIKKYYAL